MLNVLLIDDDPRVLYDLFTTYGYDVDVALDGFQGIQTLVSAKKYYDIVILDIQMPKMDGWSVLKAIREGQENPNVPIIILTSTDTEESMVTGLRRGADLYLTKPISPRKLLAHIEVLARRIKWITSQTPQSRPSDADLNGRIELLTQRENEILKHIIQGLSNQRIGSTLSISETTVKNHLAHIYKKLNVSNRTEAAFLAQKLKLFT